MSTDKNFGVTEDNTLSEGANKLSEESDDIRHQIQCLMADMEGIPRALVGTSGCTFSNAATEVQERFSELMGWCSERGIKLGENQSALTEAEDFAQEIFGGSQQELGGLSRGVNG